MRDHLIGKPHQRSVTRNKLLMESPSKKTRVDNSEVHPPVKCASFQLPSSPEKRVAKAWKHPIACGYKDDDSFTLLPLEVKIAALSPHFAFISKDDKIPNLIQYLIK